MSSRSASGLKSLGIAENQGNPLPCLKIYLG